jgi:multiple sugar transport system substrate-binding protein
MAATAQRYSELHPDVEIIWEKRTLQAFADFSVEKLAERYDLLVIDHPWAGFAADKALLLPLERHVPASFLADQAGNSVGLSHASYHFDGAQTALVIDAAAPVAAWRPDVLTRLELSVPDTWGDLLALAGRGIVVFPGIPIDSLMNFYMLCSTLGEDPCQQPDRVVSRERGAAALEYLRELAGLVTDEMYEWNPIKVYEAMTGRDEFAYCPFAYGYSNYARNGYARRRLQFGDMVAIGGHGRCRSTLGGTGLAVSARCPEAAVAVDYAMYVASAECQASVYVETGGQPGHRTAWLDESSNRLTGGYFAVTLPALDRAFLRPRYSGYLDFQDHAGNYVQNYMRNGGNPDQVLDELDRLYRDSRKQVRA